MTQDANLAVTCEACGAPHEHKKERDCLVYLLQKAMQSVRNAIDDHLRDVILEAIKKELDNPESEIAKTIEPFKTP